MSLLIGLSLWSFDVSDPTFNRSISSSIAVKNYAGTFGAYLSGFLTDVFGLGSYFFMLFFLVLGIILVTKWIIIPLNTILGTFILAAFLLCCFEAFTIGINDVQGGGFLGALLYAKSHEYFNPVGGAIVWFFLMILGLQLCFNISWVTYFSKFMAGLFYGTKSVARRVPKSLPALPKMSGKKYNENNVIDLQPQDVVVANNFRDKSLDVKDPLGFSKAKIDEDIDYNDDYASENDYSLNLTSLENKAENTENKAGSEKKKGFWDSVFSTKNEDNNKQSALASENKNRQNSMSGAGNLPISSNKAKQNFSNNSNQNTDNNLPSTELLSPIPVDSDMPSMARLEEKGDRLMQGLLDFNVNGQLAGILPGPVVTMYEIRPERGVKSKRFEVLSKDIAMSIKAIAVRVQAPIPGTDTVGIEVPNDKRQTVSFREVLESDAFINSSSLLTLGIGKNIFGKPSIGKLDEMPHLLVAGATGAGKSVCLNSIILSILYKAKPHEVKMLLIDPKRVELAMYADLPHLVHPVVTEMDLAKNALNWAIDEMDQRYQLFANNKVRNFTEYNKLVDKKKNEVEQFEDYDDYDGYDSFDDTPPEPEKPLLPLPYLVIIIDELADLMMQKGKEVEAGIVRLAQLARAAGIHLIIATQRPSVDVVTGLIKANFPSRIAFQVTSGTDSRTILDSVGAEALLGKGDMLFKPRAGALQRMHGAFVTDEEVTAVVEFWKNECKTEYLIDFSEYGSNTSVESGGYDGDHEFDPMYDTVLERVMDMEEISISMLQRQFKLGFGRAGRIMDQLEREGIVGPSTGSKPRRVLR